MAASAAFCISTHGQISADFHKGRRQALRQLMGPNSVAFVPAYPVHVKSNDIHYKYHPSPDLYYLTGIKQPHSAVFIFSDSVTLYNGKRVNEIAFITRPDSVDALWHGPSLDGSDVLGLGIDAAYYTNEFKETELGLSQLRSIYAPAAPEDVRDDLFNKGDLYSIWLNFNRKVNKDSLLVDHGHYMEMMARLRQNKLPAEIERMRRAIDITCQAQTALMKTVLPGMNEAQAQALIEFEFMNNGAQGPAFPSICGSGPNSCILHYSKNDRTMMWDDLLLVDVGAEYDLYAADVTRTMPIDGEFSDQEKAIYELVLRAQKAGIAKCRPGEKFWASGDVCKDVIAQGLVDLGITAEYRDYKRYFMHGVSHYLGLDVHDVGLYGELKPGQVVTVEPGIYIAPGSPCDKKWWGIGVRIEDDVLITSGAPDVLSDCVVKEVAEVEKLMKKPSPFSKLYKD